MIKKIFYTIAIIVLLTNSRICIAQGIDIKTIDLKQEVNDSITLEFTYMPANLKSLDWSTKFMKKVAETYKGIPENDSIQFYGNFEEAIQFSYDLFKSNVKNKDTIAQFVSYYKLDTLKLSQTPIKQGFISVIGFYKNKQFIIADANRNEDFSDDIKYEFDINFRNNPTDDVINKLPATDYWYQIYNKGDIHTYHRKFILYPNKQHPYTLDKKQIEYSSNYKLRDYWKGEALINDKPIEFYYQSRDNIFGALFVKPKNIAFSKTDNAFNYQFMHNTSDIFAIEDGLYVVDSINRDISKLYLKKIGKNPEMYGNVAGSYLKNFELKNLKNKRFNTSDIVKSKKLTLIDFWGTWCAPCIKMTPVLKSIQKKYLKTLNIIGIVEDVNNTVVRKYIKKHNITWTNVFITRKDNNPILKDLNIFAFPTFILVDDKGKILYRGGSDTFDEMLKFLK